MELLSKMFFCDCLNIIGEINNVDKKLESLKVKSLKVSPVITDSSYYELLDFFKLAIPISMDEIKISIQHSAFLSKVKMDQKWIVSKCLNCDFNVFATSEVTNEVLINGKMLRDKNRLLEMIKNENYSMPFKIILKPIDLLPNTLKSTINDDSHVKTLYAKLQDFIAVDEKETEAEIRRITSEMNMRHQRAEREFQLIVTLINSIESSGGSYNNISSSTLESTNNIQSSFSITPPVTPENSSNAAQLNFDQSNSPPLAKMANNNNNNHNNNHHHHIDHNHREGISKHNSAIVQKQITRTIDFEDDIFELDDGEQIKEEDAKDENDRYHKYSDTEGSDVDDMIVEKRQYTRGRSGSLALARSAPISMPQFLHHTNAHLQEKHLNEQDIASSIKLLAKSIHADAQLFGELPNRQVFKYNAEF